MLALKYFTPILHSLLVLLITSSFAHSASLEGQVFSIDRGDLISLSTPTNRLINVKLWGISTPDPATSLGKTSRKHLHMLLAGKFVTIVYQTMNAKGVLLGRVLLGGEDINLRMIEDGQARAATGQQRQKAIMRTYRQAEQKARLKRLGMWNQHSD